MKPIVIPSNSLIVKLIRFDESWKNDYLISHVDDTCDLVGLLIRSALSIITQAVLVFAISFSLGAGLWGNIWDLINWTRAVITPSSTGLEIYAYGCKILFQTATLLVFLVILTRLVASGLGWLVLKMVRFVIRPVDKILDTPPSEYPRPYLLQLFHSIANKYCTPVKILRKNGKINE